MLALVLAFLVVSATTAPTPRFEGQPGSDVSKDVLPLLLSANVDIDGPPSGFLDHQYDDSDNDDDDKHPKVHLPHTHHHHHHHNISVSAPTPSIPPHSLHSIPNPSIPKLSAPLSSVSETPTVSKAPLSTPAATLPMPQPSPIPSSPKVTPSLPSSVKPTSTPLTPSAAAYLNAHNDMRKQHSAAPLAWSEELASAAKAWATECKWAHSNGTVGNFGENIAAGTGNFTASDAVGAWNNEASQFNPNDPIPSHWTQIVWKATTQLGCAVASCPGLLNADVAQLHVCEYSPPGNILGQFQANVS